MAEISRVRVHSDYMVVYLDDGSTIRALPTASDSWFAEGNTFGLGLIIKFGNLLGLQVQASNTILAYPTSDAALWYCGPNVPGDPGGGPEPEPAGDYYWPFDPTNVVPLGEYGQRPSPGGGVPAGFHSGMDFALAQGAPAGAPIHVAAAGKVIHVRNKNNAAQPGNTSWGNRVGVQHVTDTGRILYTYYCHMQDGGFAQVSEGQDIAVGTVLGYVGRTGLVTGNHLHFVTYYDGLGNQNTGNLVNPRDWMAEFNPTGQVWGM